MSISLNSNIQSLRAQRQLDLTSRGLSTAYERLASGSRINHAADDAAGLAIASQLNAKAKVFTQAIRNVNDGVSVAAIAEGALSNLQDISIRQRELATQAANGSYSTAQRNAMNVEANQLVKEYNRIVATTTFNGTALFGSNSQGVRIQAGAGSENSLLLGLGTQLGRNVGDGTFTGSSGFGALDPVQFMGADFNEDGFLDILQTDIGTDTVNVYLADQHGNFTGGPSFSTSNPPGVKILDYNGDGHQDLIIDDTGTVTVYAGDGRGNLTDSGTTSLNYIASADLNGDGRVDVIDSPNSNQLTIRLNQGNGVFTTSTITVSDPSTLQIADLNGDGSLDLLTSNGGLTHAYLGTGKGAFGAAKTTASNILAIGDLNEDGRIDIVSSAGVRLGVGDGTFGAAIPTAVGSSAIAADLNGDGHLDLISSDPADISAALISFGNGDGSFCASMSVAGSFGRSGDTFVVGNINGDDRPDLALLCPYETGLGAGASQFFLANGNKVSSTQALNLCTRAGALDAMRVIDANMARVSNEIGMIGAISSRFGAALGTLQAGRENIQAAAGRILDADIAGESANLVKNQILQQASASVLAQANQAPALAITLLRG